MNVGTPTFQSTELKEGKKHFGDLLWFTLSNVCIAPDNLKKLLDVNGFNPELTPSYHNATSLNRICRGKEKKFKGYILRPVINNNKTVVWGLVREFKEEGQKRLQHETIAALTLDIDSDTTSVDLHTTNADLQTDAQAAFGGIVNDFNRWKNNLSDQEVRPVLTTLLRSIRSLTIRDSGGVYFIPTHHKNESRALFAVIKGIGSSVPFLMPIEDDDENFNRSTLQQIAVNSIEAELKDLKEEIDTFDDKTRDKTIKSRLQEFDVLRKKAQLYVELLSGTAGELEKKIDELKNKALEVLENKGRGVDVMSRGLIN